ncbi:MAG: heme exporter protein CcmB [Bacteroidia bacterium]|nr:heme exporter protein CcmB [Bacteroidia bacterium]
MKAMWNILVHDFRTERRRKYALGGILLYVASAVFITYMAFMRILEPEVWNALFWIVLLFAAVNAAAKSFMAESSGRMLYYFYTVPPRSFIMGKTLYNFLLLFLIGLICYLLFTLLHSDPNHTPSLFLAALLLGSLGISGTLTLMSAIASRSGSNFTLMSILSFPLLLPLLLMLIRLTHFSISGLEFTLGWKYMVSLAAMDGLVLSLSYLLFPYLWKE